MRTCFASLAVLLALSPFAALASGKTAMPNPDTTAITRQLERYEQALNSSDVDAVMRLYSDDAVFMPQHSLPVAGAGAIRSAYQQIFKTIRLSIDFTIDEIQPLSRDWAFARTRSNGTVRVLASDGPAGAEANQEIFLLHRGKDAQWRFARYIFSTTNPPRQP
ncbi:SgcJ/EcaC family oxidoreductase [Stenotrophomonas maltophilia]|uniref:YybH family protein n=1 Tax=Stenotrophomonas maltophilia TaxID=40324 RepID=UPI00107685B0|nr:SgcJ/EcaC family oxidoreductase [Stenotrophomonas maltophilia]TFZ47804.1 SgcJ/EcaC family oxidoreductase [Stenotrophomonas maltophilia]